METLLIELYRIEMEQRQGDTDRNLKLLIELYRIEILTPFFLERTVLAFNRTL